MYTYFKTYQIYFYYFKREITFFSSSLFVILLNYIQIFHYKIIFKYYHSVLLVKDNILDPYNSYQTIYIPYILFDNYLVIADNIYIFLIFLNIIITLYNRKQKEILGGVL